MDNVTELNSVDPYFEILVSREDAALLHTLRRNDPVHFVPGRQLWFITRHADVKRLYSDAENVTQDASAWMFYRPRTQRSGGCLFEAFGFSTLDAAAHKRLRRLFGTAFIARAIKRMEHQIKGVVERYAQPLKSRPGEVIDFIGNFTQPIPTVVISRILGIPLGEDEKHFCKLAQAVFPGFFPFQSDRVLNAANQAFSELADWVEAMAEQRRRAPGEDLVSDLMSMREGEDPPEAGDIVRLITALLAAGTETTARGGLAMLTTLFNHPQTLEAVRADRGLVPKAVSEILRWGFDGADAIVRYALRDFELGNRLIRKGQMLLLSSGGANRDPDVFPDPDVFDLQRDQRDSLVFGHGVHYCIGAQLARAELGCMLETLMDIAPPGSKVRCDLMQYEDESLAKRPSTFPVEIAG